MGEKTQIISDLPDAGQHEDRTLAFGPDGRLYLSVGSTSNTSNEPNPENATMLVASPDGKSRKIFASGLRNTIGFDWNPVTHKLYGMDMGIDWQGDDHQREELNHIQDGHRYGWPYVYENGIFDPQHLPQEKGYTLDAWRKESTSPDLTYTAHASPIGFLFYTGSQFPAEYKNDAFVAFHGSWNRAVPSGYEVVRVHFDAAGRPVSMTPFVTGFVTKQNGKWGQFGRPCGLAQMPDGSLLVSDDTEGVIYRISYGQNVRPDAWEQVATNVLSSQILAGITSIRVTSPDFQDGGRIPEKNSDYGDKLSPALNFAVPPAARSLVLIMEDPDAQAPRPFVHWLIGLACRHDLALDCDLGSAAACGGSRCGAGIEFHRDVRLLWPASFGRRSAAPLSHSSFCAGYNVGFASWFHPFDCAAIYARTRSCQRRNRRIVRKALEAFTKTHSEAP